MVYSRAPTGVFLACIWEIVSKRNCLLSFSYFASLVAPDLSTTIKSYSKIRGKQTEQRQTWELISSNILKQSQIFFKRKGKVHTLTMLVGLLHLIQQKIINLPRKQIPTMLRQVFLLIGYWLFLHIMLYRITTISDLF